MTLPFSTCIRLTVSFLPRYEISSPLPSAAGNNSGFSLTSERSRLWIHPCGMLPVSVSQILTVFLRQCSYTRSRRNILLLLGGGLRSVKEESRDTVFLHSACAINKEHGDTVSRAHLLKSIGEYWTNINVDMPHYLIIHLARFFVLLSTHLRDGTKLRNT